MTDKILLSWCNALRYLRNISSHNGRLYARLHHTLPSIHHTDKDLMISKLDNYDKKLFVYFIAMRYIILAMSKESQSFWNSKLQNLQRESNQKKVNLAHYGFPENWLNSLMI